MPARAWERALPHPRLGASTTPTPEPPACSTLHRTSADALMMPLRFLARLTQLRELELIDEAEERVPGAALELLPASALPAIRRLTFCSASRLLVRLL